MTAKRRSPEDGDVGVLEKPSKKAAKVPRPGTRLLMIGAASLASIVGLSYAVWRQVGAHVVAGQQYQVDPEQIAITPPPPWIHSDIKKQVIRDASLNGPLSLLDNQLTVRMATAFSAHPWVAHVERVSKRYPAGLEVALSYRKPVAMVEVNDGQSALPVDAHGVLLPTADFSPEEAAAYPRIGEIHTAPAGAAGTPWGDGAVGGAAQIAAVLDGEWKGLGLLRIVPAGRRAAKTGSEYVYALVTNAGTTIQWGRAPATNMPGEIAAVEKVAQLKKFAAQNSGTLDPSDGSHLELRGDGALVAKPRPEVKELPRDGQ